MKSWVVFGGALALAAHVAVAHVFIPKSNQLGQNPTFSGNGWAVELYLVPDSAADNLLTAENYATTHEPDMTFRTNWIDYPSGDDSFRRDATYETVGDLLDNYLLDVDNPEVLNHPFTNILLKFSGYVSVEVDDNTSAIIGLPVWVDYRTIGHDGYRLLVGLTIYRFPVVPFTDWVWEENPIHEAPGMHRIEFNYFNKYDPFGSLYAEYAGIELYTHHGGGLPLAAGQEMINPNHPEFGPGTIITPTVIYTEDAIAPVGPADFDADADVDFEDYRWLQNCFTGQPEGFSILAIGCEAFDVDKDDDIDAIDYEAFVNHFLGE
ncbi:MAG: hypothetical protein ACPGXK_05225 [Phycisphaerae bacterium]